MSNFNQMFWHPKSKVTEPRNHSIVQVYRDFWWVVDKDGNIALWEGRAPQCNPSRELADILLKSTASKFGGVALEQIPLAFVEVDVRDF